MSNGSKTKKNEFFVGVFSEIIPTGFFIGFMEQCPKGTILYLKLRSDADQSIHAEIQCVDNVNIKFTCL